VKKEFLTTIAFALLFSGTFAQLTKAPAYPLIAHDPYFSIWSFTDKLNESQTKHWTGKEQPLIGIVKVDGKAYNFLGLSEDQKDITPAVQKSVQITATQTTYQFICGSVSLELNFLSTLLMNNLDLLSIPVDLKFKIFFGCEHRNFIHHPCHARLYCCNSIELWFTISYQSCSSISIPAA